MDKIVNLESYRKGIIVGLLVSLKVPYLRDNGKLAVDLIINASVNGRYLQSTIERMRIENNRIGNNNHGKIIDWVENYIKINNIKYL